MEQKITKCGQLDILPTPAYIEQIRSDSYSFKSPLRNDIYHAAQDVMLRGQTTWGDCKHTVPPAEDVRAVAYDALGAAIDDAASIAQELRASSAARNAALTAEEFFRGDLDRAERAVECYTIQAQKLPAQFRCAAALLRLAAEIDDGEYYID